MSILICTTKYGGCGFIGHGDEFASDPDFECDFLYCPGCSEDHAFQLTKENLESLTNESNRELGKKLIENGESVVAIAECGCVHHAEDGVVCPHDIALARDRHNAQYAS